MSNALKHAHKIVIYAIPQILVILQLLAWIVQMVIMIFLNLNIIKKIIIKKLFKQY